ESCSRQRLTWIAHRCLWRRLRPARAPLATPHSPLLFPPRALPPSFPRNSALPLPRFFPSTYARASPLFSSQSSGFRQNRRGIARLPSLDRKSTRLNSSHVKISYAVL